MCVMKNVCEMDLLLGALVANSRVNMSEILSDGFYMNEFIGRLCTIVDE